MGVTGLWRLIQPAGEPVPVETLENKVLAVDISIWLHQVVKGYQDARGAPLPNAHLMGLFERLCKLLYFKIKPVFVFDGGFPDIKRETIVKRQDNKIKYNSESARLRREIVLLLSKKTAIGSILGNQISPPKKASKHESNGTDDDIFKLPALPRKEDETESESDNDDESSSSSVVDLHSMDIESDSFKNMPVKEKYDLLIELKETRKMNSWGKLNELPKKSENFSDFQMNRLLKRRKVQECLEETEKEMGDSCLSLNELESLLNEEGINTKIETLPTHRIASNDTTRFLFIKDVKQAFENAKKQQQKLEAEKVATDVKPSTSTEHIETEVHEKVDELDEDLKKAIQMSLECVNNSNTSEHSISSNMLDSDYSDTKSDSSELDSYVSPDMSSAKSFFEQYTDFTHNTIKEIICSRKCKDKNKIKGNKIDRILKELDNEKSIITEKVQLSSSEEENESSKKSAQEPIAIHSADYTSEKDSSSNKIDECNTTQSSVAYVENLSQEVITLDSSSGEIQENIHDKTEENDSDSNDDDFEEVPEDIENKVTPVVQLNVKLGEAPEDDIFEDIFIQKKDEKSVSLHTTGVDQGKDTQNFVEDYVLEKSISPALAIVSDKEGNKMEENIKTYTEVSETKKVHDCVEIERTSKESVENESLEHTNSKEVVNENNSLVTQDNKIRNVNEELINEYNEMVNENKQVSKESLSVEELTALADALQDKEDNLLQEKGRIDRMGRNITEQMTKEVQELLKIFGVPYVVAPMEAEAQCAFLESVKLTDGTITDDNDIWLFGGKTVYKNFFNRKEHVLQFLSDKIEKSFNLSRDQLVLLALLVGSDYTTGVPGVGPVTALEILASFPYNKKDITSMISNHDRYSRLVAGLQEFKNWVRAGRRTDNTILKKKLRNVQVTDDFPSVRVVQAYFEPNVEKSEEKFTWGELDITILRDYTKSKFGWSQSKLDEILKPLLKRKLESKKTQKSLHDYFRSKIKMKSLENQMSKRVKAAVQMMSLEGIEQPLLDEEQTKHIRLKQKRKLDTKKKSNKIDEVKTDDNDSQTSKEDLSSKIKPKQRRITKTQNVVDCESVKSDIINIPKLDRHQEIIPQREKEREHILQNKLKAIEIFRKNKIYTKTKRTKRKVNLPKPEANLSESDTD